MNFLFYLFDFLSSFVIQVKFSDLGVSGNLKTSLGKANTFVGSTEYMSVCNSQFSFTDLSPFSSQIYRRRIIFSSFSLSHSWQPERIKGQKHSYSSDTWSLGLTLFKMIVGKIPYESESGVVANFYSVMTAITQNESPALLLSSEEYSFSTDCKEFFQEWLASEFSTSLSHSFLWIFISFKFFILDEAIVSFSNRFSWMWSSVYAQLGQGVRVSPYSRGAIGMVLI